MLECIMYKKSKSHTLSKIGSNKDIYCREYQMFWQLLQVPFNNSYFG